MKRFSRAAPCLALVLSASVCLAAGPGGDANLLENPSFESELEGWGQWGTDTDALCVLFQPGQAWDGDRMVFVKKSADTDIGMLWQRLDGRLAWGDTVYVQVRVKRLSGTEGEPFVTICAKRRDTFEYLCGQTVKGRGSKDWEKVTLKYTIPAPADEPDLSSVHIEFDVGVMGGSPGDTFVFDDAYVGRIPRAR